MQPEPILVAVVKYLLNKPNFSTVFSESMKNVEINESFLESFCSGLQLSLLEKIAISLALSDSENPDARLCGKYEVNFSINFAKCYSCICFLDKNVDISLQF
jgi:CCR4-NOT transcription complex subunit 1